MLNFTFAKISTYVVLRDYWFSSVLSSSEWSLTVFSCLHCNTSSLFQFYIVLFHGITCWVYFWLWYLLSWSLIVLPVAYFFVALLAECIAKLHYLWVFFCITCWVFYCFTCWMIFIALLAKHFIDCFFFYITCSSVFITLPVDWFFITLLIDLLFITLPYKCCLLHYILSFLKITLTVECFFLIILPLECFL